MKSTIKQEAEIGRRHTPDIAWPTIAMIVMLWAVWIAATWLAVDGTIPLWAGAVANTAVLYAIYTPLHDAMHSAIIPRKRGWRWVNTAIGMASAGPIWMFFHHHRKSHFLHHARANMPDDPDLYAKGSFLHVFFVGIPWALLNYFNPVALNRECRHFKLTATETAITMGLFAAQAALVVAVIAAGYGLQFLVLWLIPWFVGNLLMLAAFGWFPHHDHSETGRYRDTRIALFPLGDFLFLQQNLHLVHHMMPWIPWYRYRATFDELRPLLERHHARIEGFWPESPGHHAHAV